jgi:hypothetical protein
MGRFVDPFGCVLARNPGTPHHMCKGGASPRPPVIALEGLWLRLVGIMAVIACQIGTRRFFLSEQAGHG